MEGEERSPVKSARRVSPSVHRQTRSRLSREVAGRRGYFEMTRQLILRENDLLTRNSQEPSDGDTDMLKREA